MKTLVVGAGAIGGVIASRLIDSGRAIVVATRDHASASALRERGLHVTGRGGHSHVPLEAAASLSACLDRETFDLIILATKAAEAIELARTVGAALSAGGTLLTLQNGGVAFEIAEQTGEQTTLGGISNIGAVMHAPGVYEQRNEGHLLLGELPGGLSPRAREICAYLSGALDVRLTSSFTGCVWSKLLINCSVTTLGAIGGTTMRRYVDDPDCLRLFLGVYRETLGIASAGGVRPERMLIDPIPPVSNNKADDHAALRAWTESVLKWYGDVKPSMLQDLERGRATEIAYINGYAARTAARLGLPSPLNTAIVSMVESLSTGRRMPSMDALRSLAEHPELSRYE